MKHENILSERLSFLIEQAGDLSGSELARRIDLPGATVNRLISGSVQDPRISTLQAIADYFRLTPDQLLGMAPLPNTQSSALAQPAPRWLACFSLAALASDAPQPHTQFAWCTEDWAKGSNSLFAVQLGSNQYEPIFTAQSTLIADHTRAPQHNDYVLIKREGETEAIIRQFYTEGSERYFYSLRKELPIWHAKTINYKLLGVIISVYTKFL